MASVTGVGKSLYVPQQLSKVNKERESRTLINRGLKKMNEVGKTAFDGVGTFFGHLSEFRSNLDNFAGAVRAIGYGGEIAKTVKGTSHAVFNNLALNLSVIDAIGLFGTVGYFGGGKFVKDCKNFKRKFAHIIGQTSFGIANAAGLTLLLQQFKVFNVGTGLPVFTTSLSYIGVGFAGIGTAFLGIDAALSLRDAIVAKKAYAKTKCVEGIKKAKLLRDVSILKITGFALDTASKAVLIAALTFKLGPAGAIVVPALGLAAIGFYCLATVLQSRADKISIKDGPLKDLAAKVDAKKGKLKSARNVFNTVGFIAETVDGAEKFSKFAGSWLTLVGSLVKDAQTSQVLKGLGGAFKGVEDLIGATAIISNLAKLFGKENGKYIWQRSKLEFGNVVAMTVASVGSLRLFLIKSDLWGASQTTTLIWSNVKNIAVIAAASFRLAKSGKNIYERSMEIRYRANWIKAERIVNCDINDDNKKTALKIVKCFKTHYEKKLKKVEKREKSNFVKKVRYTGFLDTLKIEEGKSPHTALKNFYDLKRLSIDLKPEDKKGQVEASERTNGDLLAYKAVNAKRATILAAKSRKKSIFATVNDVLLCTVVTTATVFMFTPVGIGAQLALAVTGVSLNTVGMLRFFYDKQPQPKYNKLRFGLVTKRRDRIAASTLQAA